MSISVSPSDPRPIYVQIMDEIRRAIVLQTLSPEDPLPSVRQLAATLRVNPNTVSQAYRELERAGVAYVRRGQGTFVATSAVVDGERSSMLRRVAQRAVIDALRHGLSAEELVAGIQEIAGTREIAGTQLTSNTAAYRHQER